MTLDDVVLAAASGDAILFVGAGFSRGATSEHGEFPAGKGLAVELFVQAAGRDPMDGFDNVELSQVSEFFEQTLGRNRLDAYILISQPNKTYRVTIAWHQTA